MRITESKLSEILKADINNIEVDSRNIKPKDIFVAIKGVEIDGHNYIGQAISNGAKTIVCQEIPEDIEKGNFKNIRFFEVPNTRKALAILSSAYYDNAHKKMKLIGITGTNGKTTTSELSYQMLQKLGKKVGLISTVSAKSPSGEIDTGLHVTTPDALQLHKLIKQMAEENCEYLIIETTSHALDQHRTYGLKFEIGAITNITPEHLDYHKTFENYLDTKSKIIGQSKKVILNKWDPSLKKLLKKIPQNKEYKVIDYKKLNIPTDFFKEFPGEYNLENASIAFAIVEELTGKQDPKILEGLSSVKGRMEKIHNTKGLEIIIDFAHDHTSQEKILKYAKENLKGNLIHVFGCAGLRDRTKRPKMGAVSARYATKTIVTAEDPRTEDLDQINKEIELGLINTGAKLNKDYFIIKDRQDAINYAINELAKKKDIVLITGKGHEKSMCFGSTEYPWSDQEAVNRALSVK